MKRSKPLWRVFQEEDADRLMAAAPAMLAMLIRVRGWIDSTATSFRVAGDLAYDLDALIKTASPTQATGQETRR